LLNRSHYCQPALGSKDGKAKTKAKMKIGNKNKKRGRKKKNFATDESEHQVNDDAIFTSELSYMHAVFTNSNMSTCICIFMYLM
jgi:phage protein D